MACIPAEIKKCQSQENCCFACHFIAFPSIVFQSYRVIRFSLGSQAGLFVSLSPEKITRMEQEKGDAFWQMGTIVNTYALISLSNIYPVCNARQITYLTLMKENSKWKKAKTKKFPYFTKEFLALLMELCRLTLTNAFHISILQVAYQFIRLCFGAGHMDQMQDWWQRATVLLSWPNPRCFTLPSRLLLGWFTWHHSTLCIGILLPGIVWLVKTCWWRLGILGCLEMCTAQTTIG